jgi:hypothetical protein
MRRPLVLAIALCTFCSLSCASRPSRVGAVGIKAPPPAPKVIVGDLDALAVLGNAPSRATRAGAGQLSVVASSVAVDGERLGAFVEIPADTCLLAYARGAGSVDDLDLAAFGEDGSPVVVDEGPDAHPTVLLCPPHPDRIYLSAHVSSGEGLVTLAAHAVPRERAGDVGRALGARGGDGDGPRPADAWPGIDDQVRPHRAALGGKWDEFRKVAVTVDPRAPTFVNFAVDADQCVDAVVIPDDEVGQLELEAVDGEGRILAHAREGGRTRTLTLCSPFSVSASLALRPHAGRGLAAIVLARARGEVARDMAARADVAWTAATLPLDLARAKRNQELAKAGYGAPRTTTNGQLAIGRRFSVQLELPKQGLGCERVDVVAGAPLAVVRASAWDDSGALVANGAGVESATIFICTRGKARLDLDAEGRPGPFSVLVRSEKWQSPAFAMHPLAAARMLARAAEGPRGILEGALVGTRAVTLDAAHLSSWEQTVLAGKCLRIAVGAEGDGSGLVLRVFDGQSAEEIDRSHASTAVSARACAPVTGGRVVRVELRATGGRLFGVVGERMSGP